MFIKRMFDQSKLKQELLKALSSSKVRYLSMDVFDTLIRRKVHKPTDIFTLMGEQAVQKGLFKTISALDFKNIRVHAEYLARKMSSHEEITLAEIYEHTCFSESLQKELILLEQSIEQDNLFLDPLIMEVIELALSLNKKIIAISDVYLDEAFIHHNLKAFVAHVALEKLYVSSNKRLTKANTRLFSHVLTDLGITNEEIVHIGDNYNSDVLSAHKVGIKAIYYNVPDWVLTALDRESIYANHYDATIHLARIISALLIPPNLSPEAEFAYLNGCIIHGAAIAGFSKWVIKHAKQNNISTLLCVMREGEVYKAAIEHFDSEITAKIFYASRKSTFLPSLDIKKINEEIAKILIRRNYTLSNLIADLEINLKDDCLNALLDEEVSDLDKFQVHDTTALAFVIDLIHQHQEKIISLIHEKRKVFNLYLEDVINDESFALIDFGAGGTIHHQISKMASKKPQSYILFYSTDCAYEKSHDLHFTSFLPLNDETQRYLNTIYGAPEILEVCLVGSKQTTLDYELKDNHYHIVMAQDKIDRVMHEFSDAFNQGLKNYYTLSSLLDCEEDSLPNRLSTVYCLARQIAFPTEEEAQFGGNLIHQDNFGSSNQYPLITEENKEQVELYGVSTFWYRHLKNKIDLKKKLTWPQGAITQIDPDFFRTCVYFKEMKQKHKDEVNDIIEQLITAHISSVLVYCAGEFFDKLEPKLLHHNIEIKLVLDKKAFFSSFLKGKYEVMSPSTGVDVDCPVVIASGAFVPQIKDFIKEQKIGNGIIITCNYS